MESSNSAATQGTKWAINVDGMIVEIPRVIIEEIRAHPTHTIGWFNPKLRKAWKLLFPLTPTSSTLGYLQLVDPTWGRMTDPWWKFLSDTPSPEEARTLVWNLIPQISVTPILCEMIPEESLSMRRMLENQAIAMVFMGNWHATKLLQVFQPITEFSIHSIATEKMMGVLEHCVTLMPGKSQTIEMVRMTGWNLMEEAKLLPPFDECLTPNHCLVMNIIACVRTYVIQC
nr:hypothetical protein CFP56_26659 [Quercus suber]